MQVMQLMQVMQPISGGWGGVDLSLMITPAVQQLGDGESHPSLQDARTPPLCSLWGGWMFCQDPTGAHVEAIDPPAGLHV